MAKIHIENGIISSSADYGLYHGTSEIAKVEAGGLRVQGDVTAENLIVSSSVTYMTQSFSSGSTIFGDTPADDTHQFTGSVSITGSGGLSVTDGNILSHGQYAIDIDGDHTGGPRITMGDYDSTPDNFMLFGAFSSINNILTQARDFRIYDSGGYTGFYFDVSENKVGIGTTSPSQPLTVAGNISGSGNLTLGASNIPTIHLDGLVDAIVRIDKGASYRAAHLRFDTAGSANWFIGTPDSDTYGDGDELYFGTSQDTPIVAIDPNASTGLLNLTSNKISGSATSTGSFGMVGIGVASPEAKLHIGGGSSYENQLIIKSTSSTAGIKFKDSDNNTDGYVYAAGGSIAFLDAGGDFTIEAKNDDRISFSLGASEKVRILNSGNVGIGETSPDELLHIKSSTDAKPVIKLENSGNNVNSPQLVFLNSSTANDNDITGTIRFKIMNDAGSPEEIEYGTIYGRAIDVSDGTEDGELHFRTRANGVLDSTLKLVSSEATFRGNVNLGDNKALTLGADSDAQIWNDGSNTYIRNNTSDQDIIFQVNDGGSTQTEVMRIDASTSKVGIGDTSPTEGRLVVAGDGAYNNPPLHISMTTSTTFNHFINMVDSNLTAGENGIVVFGQELDSNNSAYIGYVHRSDHGNDNQLTLGFWGSNNLVNLLPNGNLGIGTEAPDTELQIRGDFDGSSALPNTDPNKGLSISKFTGAGSDYGKGDRFGITFTAASNAATDYSIAGIYGQVTNVSSYVGGSLIFATRLESESALTTKMVISSSGNVGIGTESPEQLLHLKSEAPFLAFTDSSNNSESGVLYRNTSGTNVGYAIYDFGNNALKFRTLNNLALTIDSSGNAEFHRGNISGSATSTGSFGHGFFGGNVGVGINPDMTSFDRVLHVGGTSTAIVRFTGTTYSNDGGYVGLNYGGVELWQKRNAYMRFGTNNTERIRIDASGNVGIGKTSLSKTLHVDSNIGSAGSPNGIMMTNTIDGSNSKIYMYANNDAGTTKNASITLDPDAETMAIDYNGNAITISSTGDLNIAGGDLTLTGATTSIIGEQSAGATRAKIKFPTSSGDGDITFETTTNGAGAITEQMRITHEGNVGIGQTNPTSELHVVGNIKVQDSSDTSDYLFFQHNGTDGRLVSNRGKLKLEAQSSAYVVELVSSGISGSATSTGSFGSVQTSTLFSTDGGRVATMASGQMVVRDHFSIAATKAIFLDGGSNTFIRESSSDNIEFATNNGVRLNIGNSTSAFRNNVTLLDTTNIGTSTFVSGITGDGFRIDDNGSDGTFLEIDNIFVRNTLRTHIFQKDVVKATNGILFISDSGVISGSTGTTGTGTVTFDNTKSATFNDNDILLFKDASDDGTINGVQFQINGSVSTAGDFDTYNVDNVVGNLSNLNVGGTAARISGGTVAIDASSTHSPFIDVNASSGSAVVRMGKLSGITSPVFGSLGEEFGLWASGSVYLEGSINATSGGFIAGWSLNSNTIEKVDSNGGVKIDSSNKRIDFLSDASTTRLRVGQVDSNKFGIRGFNDGGNRVFEISEVRNEIAGWSIQETVISSSDGNVQIDAGNSRFLIKSGSGERVRMGLLNDSKQYGISGSDENGNLLFKLGDAGNEIAGWRIAQGKLDFDHPTGSIAIDASNKNIAIYTGSIDAAKPKVVMGNLPTTGDARYGFAVFSGSADADISDDNSYAVLITKDKARLAGWDLVPGRLKSGTVADINGNNASIALGGGSGGTNALNAGATPTSNLFFVSASSNPIFYVGENFSYVNDVLTAAGWTIDTQAITKTTSTDTKGVSLNSGASVLMIHGTDGKDNFAGTGKNNVRVGVGRLGVNKFGIAGFDGSGNELFKLGEDGNEIAGWTIGTGAISKNDVKLDSTANGEGLYVKKTSFSSTTAGGFLGLDSGTAKFNVGNASKFIKFDGSNFTVDAGNFSLDSSGNMTATSANLTGTVTATAGAIGGYTIGSGKLSVGSDPGVNISGSGVIIAGNISSPGPEDAVYFGVLREHGGSSGISGSVSGLISGDSSIPTFNSGTHLGFQINKGVYLKSVNDEAHFRVGGTGGGQPFINFNQQTPSLEISSSNFHLDTSGNVDMTGTINATAGAIGGFTIANNDITGSGGTFVTSGKTSDSGQDTTTRAELLPANFLVRADAGAVGGANGHDESHIVFDAVTAEAFNFFNGETNDKFRTVSTRMENAHFGKYDVNDSFTTGNLVIGKGGRSHASIRTTTDDSSPDSIILPETTNGGWIIGDALEVKPVSAGLGALTRNYTNAVFSVVGQSYLGNTELQGDVVLGYNSGDTIIFSGSVDSDISMGATRKLYFDGGTHTYITEAAADRIEIVAGNYPMISIKEDTTSSRTLIYRDLYINGANQSVGSGDTLDADYLRLHNNGSNSYIDFGSGNLYIRDESTTRITITDSTGMVTIAQDLTVSDDLFVGDCAHIDALHVGTGTDTDPGDNQLVVDGDITVADDLFVGDCAHIDALHVGTGTDTDPGDGNLSVDGNILINGITDAGGVPKFLVRRTSDTAALTQNAWNTIVFNGEDFDTGSDFNVTNGIFSAPATGYYHFSWQLRFNSLPDSTDYIWTKLVTTDEDILAGIVRIDAIADSTIDYWQTGASVTVHLDSGDTVKVQAYPRNSGTGVTIDGASSNYQSWFSGHMII